MAEGFWRNRPVLITGATGLLGSWLVKRLHALAANPVCLVRDWVPQSELVQSGLFEQVPVVRGDVCDAALLERTLGEYEIDTVFHLAAQTITGIANRNPLSTFETNIRGTWSLLEACRRSPCVRQIVVASSDKAYGTHEQLPYTEDAPLRGEHPYDVSKSCADLIARSYALSYRLPVAITRCCNLYGGGDLNWNRIIPGTIRSVLHGQRPVIRSDGSFVRDYLYIEDGVNAYITLAEHLNACPDLAGEAFNFSSEDRVPVLAVVALILSLMDSDLEPELQNRASNEIRHQYLSAVKARTMLGWQPHDTFESGLLKTISWYQDFFCKDEQAV